MPAARTFSEAGDDPVDQKAGWDTSPAHATKGGPTSSGFGCVGNATIGGTGCHQTPHGSAKRKMLAMANDTYKDEEAVCLGCHNTTDISGGPGLIQIGMEYRYNGNYEDSFLVSVNLNIVTAESGAPFDGSEVGMYFKMKYDGSYRYAEVLSNTTSELTLDAGPGQSYTGLGGDPGPDLFYLRASRVTHPVGETLDEHDTVAEENSATFNWNAPGSRHVECEDCHDPHQAKEATSTLGSASFGAVNAGVWGVTPTYETVYRTGLATFADTNDQVYGSGGQVWDSSMPGGGDAVGWRIKNNNDQSGTWYTVTAVTSDTQLTITPAYDSKSGLTDSAYLGSDVDYSMVKVTYTKTTTPTEQAEICLRCHGYFSYSTGPNGADTPPESPSGMYDGAGAPVPVDETEIGADFAPTHLAIHPVMALGKNQPLKDENSNNVPAGANWPVYNGGSVSGISGTAVTGSSTSWSSVAKAIPGWKISFIGAGEDTSKWYEVATVSDSAITLTETYTGSGSPTDYRLSAGLGSAFVPPWGPWSRVVCTDCHAYGEGGAAGPHGSLNKWQLVGAQTAQSFDWWDGSVQTISYTGGSVEVFCKNCHRRDVYGDAGYAAAGNVEQSRLEHPVDNGRNDPLKGSKNRWANEGDGSGDIGCMSCHGGDSLGGLHGTSAGQQWKDWAGTGNHVGATAYGVGSGNGGVDLADERGTRFLNGATWVAVERATTSAELKCWTKGETDEVNICTQSHGDNDVGSMAGGIDGGTLANYDY